MIRETCIWETPRRRPISCCVRSSSKRSRSTVRSRSRELGALGGELDLDPLIARLLPPHRLDPSAPTLILAAPRGVKREGAARGVRLQTPPGPPPRRARGALRSGRRSASCPAHRRAPPPPARTAIVRSWRARGSRRSQDPVPEVAAKLAQDRRRRVGLEAVAALRIEAVERLDQAEARDLDQVFERFGGAAVAKREAPRQGQKAAHELFLELRVASRCVSAQKRRPRRPPRLSRSRGDSGPALSPGGSGPCIIAPSTVRKNGLSSTCTDRPVSR